jgi:hypothetical protein
MQVPLGRAGRLIDLEHDGGTVFAQTSSARTMAIDGETGHALAAWARGGNTTHGTLSEPAKTMDEHDRDVADAATRGTAALQATWAALPADVKSTLKPALDRRHKPAAAHADAANDEAA